MQFTSIAYLVFLAVGACVYYALPSARTRTVWLLIASYAFYYSLSASWTVILALITALGYASGMLLDRSGTARDGAPMPKSTRRLLTVSILLTVLSLFVFKYTGFAASLLNGGLSLAGAGRPFPLIRLVLPIGISFWTFQTIAYVVDVARGRLRAERDVLRYALFIAFFPQVTAGPIARGGQLLPQLEEKHEYSRSGLRSGLTLMTWGFFKKLVVADALAVIVETVYSRPQAYGNRPLVLAVATVAFSVQIYCDFSGYTDIVRGSARLFGVELLRNFDRPYAARSVKEFWRRWHMTLMSWLKDYVYIPLGGSRVAPWRRYANILTVFLVSGLWHGAGLTFVVWGLLNGAYQVIDDLLRPLRERVTTALRLGEEGPVRRTLQVAVTFGLITVAWVFFRAGSLADALYILGHMASTHVSGADVKALVHLGLDKPQIIVAVLAAVFVFGLEALAARVDLPALLGRQVRTVRWAVYQAGVLAVVLLGHYGPTYSAAAFAYFKF